MVTATGHRRSDARHPTATKAFAGLTVVGTSTHQVRGQAFHQVVGRLRLRWLSYFRIGGAMRIFRPAVLVFGLALVGASAAGAFTAPPSSISDGNEGEIRLLWTQTVDPADVGKACEVVLV